MEPAELLMAITGGVGLETYFAQQREHLDAELRAIREDLRKGFGFDVAVIKAAAPTIKRLLRDT